ncbi:MAG: hypothetical protein VKS61_14495 [Candidatus Sericytochromatia bacterium]|nr:hypothetical protein [Candidatus Sericytochromatia bacterium]
MPKHITPFLAALLGASLSLGCSHASWGSATVEHAIAPAGGTVGSHLQPGPQRLTAEEQALLRQAAQLATRKPGK